MDLTTFIIMCVILYFPVKLSVDYFFRKKKEEQEKIERLETAMQELKDQVDKMFTK